MISEEQSEPKPEDWVEYGVPSWLVSGAIIVWGQLSPVNFGDESQAVASPAEPMLKDASSNEKPGFSSGQASASDQPL